jgi:hypothetical protein
MFNENNTTQRQIARTSFQGVAMSKKVFLISLLILFAVGCGGSSGSGGSEEVAQGLLPQVFVFPGAQEERLISQEVIDLPNCTGNAESSQEVTRAHTVLYTLELGREITVSADGRAGIPGLGEVGVGMAVATEYRVGYGRSETVSRAQTVRAAAESHIQHTIQQFEIWETGELLIVAGDKNQRIPYSFRRDFSIKAVAPANIGCPGGVVSQPPPQPDPTVPQVISPPRDEGAACFRSDWESCWSYDDTTKTMTWIGPTRDSFDIGQKGVALEKIRAGYTAIFSIQSPGTIDTCVGSINGQQFTGDCPVMYQLSPGEYRIISPGPSGGFRVYR